MKRDVSARLTLDVARPATLVFSIAVAEAYGAPERLSLELDGREVAAREVLDQHGTRLHVLEAGVGRLVVDYTASVDGVLEPLPGEEVDRLRYLRPSRYAESDILWATARAEFAGLEGAALLASVSSWVGTRLAYVTGSSLPTDGAERTLLARRGVCRDFAHLVVALLRALDVPARLVAVYAPGLAPMDFHAVAEAWIEGSWRVVDATTLAPRSSLVRIATGRDAADTAFLSVYDGIATLTDMTVGAVVDVLPDDDVRELAAIG
ncbi:MULTISPECIES: transglutaminase-like domain-containing protein [Rathayibacter]|uniref:Transglutaminase n=2 Tax=Rathayibacter festucae TaxID=110937 RepID=A0A3T0T1Q4_9MICO|nr:MULTISPECIES: transglutaminase family protein [Rathayibacter]AZZ52489.1 transglutaminase [Rathayibacter festucae DSM 15932]MCJ1704364.1 transglutaminase family protein [Rathayibacter sp. VKM Ac-2926]QHC62144.1 transglutaminase [Rathayibacter festucae]ROP43472.1 transglutaminase superfamily protein [Rathayibacter sp. PhB186]ROQ03165.1 transglutaminase superfamily protein [Rathayibacter sp. PhB93]